MIHLSGTIFVAIRKGIEEGAEVLVGGEGRRISSSFIAPRCRGLDQNAPGTRVNHLADSDAHLRPHRVHQAA
jgi:hypothetical protein